MKKSSKPPETTRSSGTGRAGAAPARAESREAHEPALQDQRTVFDEAMALFHRGEFREARERFARAAQGTNREMCHAAQLHISMCDQRIARLTPELHSPEDHYNYAIALINRRQLGEAERHLRIAADALQNADHILYAQALTRALQGDLEGSYDFLNRAIKIDSRNRSLARNDPDFQEFCRRPPLRELVHPSS